MTLQSIKFHIEDLVMTFQSVVFYVCVGLFDRGTKGAACRAHLTVCARAPNSIYVTYGYVHFVETKGINESYGAFCIEFAQYVVAIWMICCGSLFLVCRFDRFLCFFLTLHIESSISVQFFLSKKLNNILIFFTQFEQILVLEKTWYCSKSIFSDLTSGLFY